jgi:uncharacterized membrane protein
VATNKPDQPPPPAPIDPPMVPFAIAGIIAFGVAALVLLPWRHSHESWWWIAVAGFLWGFPGLATMLRHDANRRRRRAAAGLHDAGPSDA